MEYSSRSYYTQINKAELLIVNEEYQKANKKYKKAFKQYGVKFADDAYNSLKVSNIINDTIQVALMSSELLSRGICPEFFEDKNKDINRIIDYNYKISENLRFKIEDLLNDDQEIRYSNSEQKDVRKVDSLNYIKFLNLIDKYGYPNEKKIGINCSISKKGIEPQPFGLLLTHFGQQRFDGIEKLLMSLLENNVISPYQYAHYMGPTKQKTSYYISPLLFIDGHYYTYKWTKEKKKKTNRERKIIGIGSIEDQIKKIKYSLNDSINEFRFYAPIDQLHGYPNEFILDKFV